jgi:hypothetical protein
LNIFRQRPHKRSLWSYIGTVALLLASNAVNATIIQYEYDKEIISQGAFQLNIDSDDFDFNWMQTGSGGTGTGGGTWNYDNLDDCGFIGCWGIGDGSDMFVTPLGIGDPDWQIGLLTPQFLGDITVGALAVSFIESCSADWCGSFFLDVVTFDLDYDQTISGGIGLRLDEGHFWLGENDFHANGYYELFGITGGYVREVAVPEPGTLSLMLLGALGLGLARRVRS